MCPQPTFCPIEDCPSRGIQNSGNIVLHDSFRNRWRCKTCKHTFSGRQGTPFFGLKYDEKTYTTVITLLANGCPTRAIVEAYGLDERTVADWQERAGLHCEKVHAHLVEQPQDLKQVQVDEIRVRCQNRQVLWSAMAICVHNRLWLGAVVSKSRNRELARAIAARVRACSKFGPLLVVTDGWIPYKQAFDRAFRTLVPTGKQGRPPSVPWSDFALVQTVKWQEAGRTLGIRVCHLMGNWEKIVWGLPAGQVVNTAYIERLNATFRQRLPGLCRRTRCLLRSKETLSTRTCLLGTVYNFCSAHCSLSKDGMERSPAMAAGITHQIWTVGELLSYHVPPPPYSQPKRQGRKPGKKEAQLSGEDS